MASNSSSSQSSNSGSGGKGGSSSGVSSRGSSSSSSSSSKGKSSSKSSGTKGGKAKTTGTNFHEMTGQANKYPAHHAKHNMGTQIDIKGKWANWTDGNDGAFSG